MTDTTTTTSEPTVTVCPPRTAAGGGSPQRRLALTSPAKSPKKAKAPTPAPAAKAEPAKAEPAKVLPEFTTTVSYVLRGLDGAGKERVRSQTKKYRAADQAAANKLHRQFVEKANGRFIERYVD